MKLLQTQYEDEGRFAAWLDEVSQACGDGVRQRDGMVFHFYTNSCKYDYVKSAVELVKERFPEAPYAGITCFGAMNRGATATSRVVVTATILEREGSRVEVVQMPLTYETQDASAHRLLALVAERPWVKAIEMLATIGGVDMPRFCQSVSDLPDEIQFYGGGAVASDVYDGFADGNFVFSSAVPHSAGSAVFVLQGGPQLYAQTRVLTGWRKLGMAFEVTEAHNNVLKSLNGVPALEQYRRYLHVPTDERFFDLAVVFPFYSETEGVPYLRVSTNYREDGSMLLGADVREHAVVNIAYGDPARIRECVNESLAQAQDFAPEVIQLFSCCSRQLYWGADVDRETLPFQSIAPTSGFYTAGEFMRSRHEVLLHNVAMVVTALREGEAAGKAGSAPVRMEGEGFSRPIMINNCLTSFINAATEELKEANEKLARMAVTDGLTGLYNRTEIERRIRQALAEYQRDPTGRPAPVVVMMDLDFFKEVNDTYGHQEGDEVLKGIAAVFRRAVKRGDISASVGRWGGEEFMFLFQGPELRQAGGLVDEIRDAAAEARFAVSGRHTLSAGVAQATLRDTADTLIGRADKGLYLAKEQGRNQSAVVSIV